MWVATYLNRNSTKLLYTNESQTKMWIFTFVWLCIFLQFTSEELMEEKDPILYYYGIEESERELPLCSARQACSALVRRYWRAPALVRLCRCARRTLCDAPAPTDHRIALSNRAYLQFCQPVTEWPECSITDVPLKIETKHATDNMNPDDLESMHHKNLQLTPPKITFKCRCREPNYWKLNATSAFDDVQTYRCASMPICKTDDYCGNVRVDMYALYQSCQCTKHHICAHNGGITHLDISEIMYRGKGWRAYCQRVADDYSYEDE